MIVSSIKSQYTGTSYQKAVNKNNTMTASGVSFSEAFSQAADSLEKTIQSNISTSSEKRELTRTEMLSIIQDKIREMKTKLENDETELTYQIGSRTFTEKEWENLIHNVDKALEQDKNKVESEKKNEKKDVNEINPNDKEKTVKRNDDTELDSLITLLLHEE
ncbi:hypothetical protein ACIZ62_18760 [Acetobacterium carbinolicum]|uniref:hypothetical protein n=1 Tax=Acetobacterium carbinolicum TaxID=52690 RepID=UPI0039BF450B